MYHNHTLLQLQQLLIQKNQNLIAFLKQEPHPQEELFDLYEDLNLLRAEIRSRQDKETI